MFGVGNRDVFVMRYRNLPPPNIAWGRGESETAVENYQEPAIAANLNFSRTSVFTAAENTYHYDHDAMNGTKVANGTSAGPKLLWKHSSPETTPMYQFLQSVNKTHNLQLSDYSQLHKWSIDNINEFWQRTWEFVGVRHQGAFTSVSHRRPIHVASTYRR